jgi:hypothetical protein
MAYSREPTNELTLDYVCRELDRIGDAIDLLESGSGFFIWNKQPPKPREGMLCFSNDSGWKVGSGAGFYEYRGGAWRKL